MANKSLRASVAYRRALISKPSVRALSERFPHTPRGSLRALLSQAGPFRGGEDAFAFTNKGWRITEEDARTLRERFQREVDAVKLVGLSALEASLSAIPIDVPVMPTFNLPAIVVAEVVRRVTDDLTNQLLDTVVAGFPGTFGRCGGMAFAGLDYFLVGRDVSDSDQQPASGPLRDYIWKRLLDSLDLNVTEFLEWVMQLHILPVISATASSVIGAAAGTVVAGPVGAAVGAFMAGKGDVIGLGGAKVLADRTGGELDKLRTQLRAGPGWPIGLIYDDSPFVWEQHQMLALSVQDIGDRRLTLTVWDNNDGRQETRWTVDVSGDELQVSSGGERDNRIKGIICEDYRPAVPPPAT